MLKIHEMLTPGFKNQNNTFTDEMLRKLLSWLLMENWDY